MWFSLFATVLILAITFYEGLQGLFTALINCILAILAAALAFGLYEDVYYAFLKDNQPDHGRAIAMMAIFIISLLVLRTLFDAFIKNNMQFPVYLDRAGGGLFGFITGMVIVGMLSIGFALLPFGDTILGFARMGLLDKTDNKQVPVEELAGKDFSNLQYTRNSTWLRQDDFTVALVSHLSNNALAGENRLTDFYPHLLEQTYFYQARLSKEAMPTAGSKLNIKVDSYSDVKQAEFFSRERTEKNGTKMFSLAPCKNQPAPGNKRIAVRVDFQDANKGEFIREQIRLVAKDQRTGNVTESLLAGINEEKAKNKLIELWDGERVDRDLGGKDKSLDLVFEVPDGIEFGEGSFVEYKQNARAPITPANAQSKKQKASAGQNGKARANKNRTEEKPAAPSPTDEPPAGQTPTDQSASADQAAQPSPSPGDERPPGPSNLATGNHDRVSGIGPARWAGLTNKLPFALTEYGGNAEVSNGEIRGGRVAASLTNDWKPVAGRKSPLDRIYVPSDMRLVQVSVEKEFAGSYLGQAMGFAADKLADFYLIDSKGGQHLPVGMYAIAKSGGQPTFEMVLLDETGRQDDAVMAKLPAFERITRLDLKDTYGFYFIYQVKPGTQVSKIHAGRQNVDLEPYKLVAN